MDKDIEQLNSKENKSSKEYKSDSIDSSVSVEHDLSALPTIENAENLAKKYLNETLQHCQQVGKVMKYFAKKLGQNEDYWYIVGLLHDVDRDHVGKIGDKHLSEDLHKILLEIQTPDFVKEDIISHGFTIPYIEHKVPVDTLIRKYLISVDELSGLIHAYSLMRPERYNGMEVSGVKKRIKDKKFAAGVSREEVINCEKYLGISLDEFVKDVIEAMK